MAIPKNLQAQRDFSGGEIDDTAGRRDDTKIHAAALRRALNIRPLATGAATRRPGRKIRYIDGGWHDIVNPTSEVNFDVTFAAGRFTARLVGGAVVSNLVAPWTEDMLDDLSWEPFGRRIFVCHRDMQPQVLEYDRDAGTWSIFSFTFREGLGGSYRAPFYRFANFGETMQPSGLTGSITLTTSADAFEAGHVGVLFTYAGRQVEITAVTDARHATATVLEELPPTYDVTMDTVSGYRVGEVVEGDTSSSKGEIVAINSGSKILTIVMTKGFGGFENNETIVGEQGQGTVSSQGAASAPAATVQWEEQFMSSVRGWPGAVSQDVQRLIFTDFGQFEQAILWSAISAPDDFLVTGDADGSIFEYVPQVCRVLYVAGGRDEFVLTNVGAFYIPISGATPLTPGSVEFRRIGSEGAAPIKPVPISDGLVYVGRNRKQLFVIIATGQTTRPYRVDSLTDFHTHLFTGIRSIAASDGDMLAPGRNIYVVNDDGTAVFGRYNEGAEWPGFFPWSGQGTIHSVAARFGDVIWTVTYEVGSGTVDAVEAFTDDVPLDGVIDLADFVGSRLRTLD